MEVETRISRSATFDHADEVLTLMASVARASEDSACESQMHCRVSDL